MEELTRNKKRRLHGRKIYVVYVQRATYIMLYYSRGWCLMLTEQSQIKTSCHDLFRASKECTQNLLTWLQLSIFLVGRFKHKVSGFCWPPVISAEASQVGVRYESTVKIRLYPSALPSLLVMLILLLCCVLIHRHDWVAQQTNASCKKRRIHAPCISLCIDQRTVDGCKTIEVNKI